MADDVEITAGSGTIIKTDQVGTDHVQYVKLMDGTLDGAGVISGDATNGLDVDVTRVGRSIIKTNATGSGAMSVSRLIVGFERLHSVSVHFSSPPTTSENLMIHIDAVDGSAYDYVLDIVDPSTVSMVNYVWFPDGELYLESNDRVYVTFTNTDIRTYGVLITTESV